MVISFDVDYEAYVFDLDGVLLSGYHTDPAVYVSATEHVLTDLGIEIEELPTELVNPSSVDAFREACRQLNVSPEEFWRRRELAADTFEAEQIEAGERDLFDDVDVLNSITVPLGIVSNNRQGTVEYVIDRFDLPITAAYGRAPCLTGYQRMKPDPYYLEQTLTELSVTPEAALFVGDRQSDIETADRAGCHSALLEREGSIDGPHEPDHRITSLRELDR